MRDDLKPFPLLFLDGLERGFSNLVRSSNAVLEGEEQYLLYFNVMFLLFFFLFNKFASRSSESS